jgi:uncharacterized protein
MPIAPDLRWLYNAPEQRWKNGGGHTRELLAAPPGDSWRWRISVAEVHADGPFSPYPGVERWIALVEGAGIELDFGGHTQRRLEGHTPLRFDGARAPSCRLIAGPTSDLNLMLRGVQGRMQRARPHAPWAPRATQAGLYTRDLCELHSDSGQWLVSADHLAWFERPPKRLWIEGGPEAAAWWLSVDEAGANA